jgi:hypothetical protein
MMLIKAGHLAGFYFGVRAGPWSLARSLRSPEITARQQKSHGAGFSLRDLREAAFLVDTVTR